jgi:hypothetical protein
MMLSEGMPGVLGLPRPGDALVFPFVKMGDFGSVSEKKQNGGEMGLKDNIRD